MLGFEKVSQRTNRGIPGAPRRPGEPAKHCAAHGCGSEVIGKLYWANDKNYNDRLVLIEQATGTYHVHADGTSCDPGIGLSIIPPGGRRKVITNFANDPVDPTPEPTEPPVQEPTTSTQDPLQILRDVLSPKIDQGEVERLVNEAMDKRSAPTLVTIQRPEREPKTLAGVQHKDLPLVLKVVGGAGHHMLLVGPAGSGKSSLAQHAAEALEVPFYALSLSPQTPESRLMGYMDVHGNYVRTLFREWYESGGIFLFDEMDNSHSAILAVINSAIANGHCAFPDQMVTRCTDRLTVAIGTANTYGEGADAMYVGRSPIDKATKDRFVVHTVGYDLAVEDAICQATGYSEWTTVVQTVRQLRRRIDEQHLLLVMSPRGSEQLCAMRAQDIDPDTCIASCLRRGMSDAEWRQLTQNINVQV